MLGASEGHAQTSATRVPPKTVPKSSKQVAPKAAELTPAQLSLDEWIIRRFRGAELMPDSAMQSTGTDARTGAPTVDGLRTAEHRDTIVALHFDTAAWKPTLIVAGTVRFVDPSGEISQITGRISARRAFRAPRKPNARAAVPGDWRMGWAYLVAVPLKTANAATSAFGGWSLVDAPTPNTKRANN